MGVWKIHQTRRISSTFYRIECNGKSSDYLIDLVQLKNIKFFTEKSALFAEKAIKHIPYS